MKSTLYLSLPFIPHPSSFILLYQRVDWGKHVRRDSPVAGCGGIPERKKLPALQTRSLEMNTREIVKSNRRLVVWIAVGVLAFIGANSPWFTAIALACQHHGGGC
ncbi:MAG: hypothetical protein R3E79_07245 [Caldilineaceae bacterium]